MARIICRKKGRQVVIELSGDATMSHTIKARDFLLTIVQGEFEVCEIDLNEVSGIDISFMELLVSFRMSMVRERKQITFRSIPRDHLFMRFMTKVGIRQDFFFGQRG
jgi:ABC-type transporter Mla MlaB component